MGLCRSVQPINRFCCYSHGRIKPECPLGAGQIIVYGLGNADDFYAAFPRQLSANGQTAVATDYDQGFDTAPDKVLYDRFTLICIGDRAVFLHMCKLKGVIPVRCT